MQSLLPRLGAMLLPTLLGLQIKRRHDVHYAGVH